MTAVGKKRQARRNEKYALLMVEARLLGVFINVNDMHRNNPNLHDIHFVQFAIMMKRKQQ